MPKVQETKNQEYMDVYCPKNKIQIIYPEQLNGIVFDLTKRSPANGAQAATCNW